MKCILGKRDEKSSLPEGDEVPSSITVGRPDQAGLIGANGGVARGR